MDIRETDEIWKPVQDFYNYEISNYGNLRHHGFPKEIPVSKKGYKQLNLSAPGKSRTVGIHRLVLEAFGDVQPSPEHVCGHRDGDGLNNRISNLRWVTHKQNAEDRIKHDIISKVGLAEYERITGEKAAYSARRELKKKVNKARLEAMVWRNPFGTLPPTEQEILDREAQS